MTKAEAEHEVFNLLKKANMYLLAGDAEELKRIQLRCSELQREYGVTSGRGKGEDYDRATV